MAYRFPPTSRRELSPGRSEMASQLAALLLACVLVSDTHALVAQLTAPARRSDGAVMMAKAKSKAKKPKAKSLSLIHI